MAFGDWRLELAPGMRTRSQTMQTQNGIAASVRLAVKSCLCDAFVGHRAMEFHDNGYCLIVDWRLPIGP